MQEEAAAGQSEAAGSCSRQIQEKRAQLTEWLLKELPESQKEHEQKRLSQMPDVLFQQEAVEKAEQLRKEAASLVADQVIGRLAAGTIK